MAILPAAACSLRSMNWYVVIELLVWLFICCVLIELLCRYWTNKKENSRWTGLHITYNLPRRVDPPNRHEAIQTMRTIIWKEGLSNALGLCAFLCLFVVFLWSIALCLCSISAMAEVHKNGGNDEFNKKEYRNAINSYTEGINVNCKDEQLNAKLYSNRATAHFRLGKTLCH